METPPPLRSGEPARELFDNFMALVAVLGFFAGVVWAVIAVVHYANRGADAAEQQRRGLVCTYACRQVTREAADPSQYRCGHSGPCHCTCPNGQQIEVF